MGSSPELALYYDTNTPDLMDEGRYEHCPSARPTAARRLDGAAGDSPHGWLQCRSRARCQGLGMRRRNEPKKCRWLSQQPPSNKRWRWIYCQRTPRRADSCAAGISVAPVSMVHRLPAHLQTLKDLHNVFRRLLGDHLCDAERNEFHGGGFAGEPRILEAVNNDGRSRADAASGRPVRPCQPEGARRASAQTLPFLKQCPPLGPSSGDAGSPRVPPASDPRNPTIRQWRARLELSAAIGATS